MTKVKQINISKESANKQPYQHNRVYDVNGDAPCLCASDGGGATPYILVKPATKQGYEQCVFIAASRGRGDNNEQVLEPNTTNTTNTLTSVEKDNLVVLMDSAEQWNIRRLTEIECERLQGFDDNWTAFGLYPTQKISQKKFNELPNDEKIKIFEGASPMIERKIAKKQRYKLCGNAVTKHIVQLTAIKLLKSLHHQTEKNAKEQAPKNV